MFHRVMQNRFIRVQTYLEAQIYEDRKLQFLLCTCISILGLEYLTDRS